MNGFSVDLVNLKMNKLKKINLEDYSGLLIGSGIRIARWTKEAKEFLKNQVKAINETNILVGVYLSSGDASNPDERPEIIEKYLIKIFLEFGLRIGENIKYDAFGGVFDLSKSTNMG